MGELLSVCVRARPRDCGCNRLEGTRATLVGARVVDCRVCVVASVWTGDTAGWSAGSSGVSVQQDMHVDTDKCSSDSVRKARVCQSRQAQPRQANAATTTSFADNARALEE